MARNTATRDLHRRIIRRRGDPCHICGQPIDYTLPYLHPMEFVVDHVIPIAKGGDDTIENKAAAHRSHNRAKSDHLDFDGSTLMPTPLKRVRAY